MGNLKSHHHHNGHSKEKIHLDQHISPDERFQIEEVYNALVKPDGRFNYWDFQEKFGLILSASLWKYLQHEDGVDNVSKGITLGEFTENADSLMGSGMMSNNAFVELLMPIDNLLRTVLEAGGVEVKKSDEAFISVLVEEITSNGDDLDAILAWINVNCPRICEPVQNKIAQVFAHVRFRNKPQILPDSEVLTPIQMFFLQHCLCAERFSSNKVGEFELESDVGRNNQHWSLLFRIGRGEDGLVKKFEEALLGYHGSTVCIFQIKSGDIYALAADEEWRVDGHKFGGPYSTLFQLHPTFKRFDATPPAVYCNFKSIKIALGLRFGQNFAVDDEMSNVEQLEIWGCQGDKSMLEELHQKITAKPKLEYVEGKAAPAKTQAQNDWQSSEDKQLLEMAGMKFSNEKREDDKIIEVE